MIVMWEEQQGGDLIAEVEDYQAMVRLERRTVHCGDEARSWISQLHGPEGYAALTY